MQMSMHKENEQTTIKINQSTSKQLRLLKALFQSNSYDDTVNKLMSLSLAYLELGILPFRTTEFMNPQVEEFLKSPREKSKQIPLLSQGENIC